MVPLWPAHGMRAEGRRAGGQASERAFALRGQVIRPVTSRRVRGHTGGASVGGGQAERRQQTGVQHGQGTGTGETDMAQLPRTFEVLMLHAPFYQLHSSAGKGRRLSCAVPQPAASTRPCRWWGSSSAQQPQRLIRLTYVHVTCPLCGCGGKPAARRWAGGSSVTALREPIKRLRRHEHALAGAFALKSSSSRNGSSSGSSWRPATSETCRVGVCNTVRAPAATCTHPGTQPTRTNAAAHKGAVAVCLAQCIQELHDLAGPGSASGRRRCGCWRDLSYGSRCSRFFHTSI